MTTRQEVVLSTTLYVLVADPQHAIHDYRGLMPESNVQWGFVETEDVFAAALRLQPWDVIIIDNSMLECIPDDLLAADETAEEGHSIFILVELEDIAVLSHRGLLEHCGYIVKGHGATQSLSRILRGSFYTQTLRQERALLEKEIERILKGWEQSVQSRTRNLERRNKELQELGELKNKFLANISHELRAPLSVVRSYVELLIDCPPDNEAEQREFIEVIDGETQRLSRMIDDLLDLTRLSTGSMEWKMGEVELKSLVPKVVNQLQPLMRKAGLSWSVQVPRETPPIWGDGDRLSQVLINLLENAAKHAPGSQVQVSVDLTTESQDGEIEDYARIVVEDSGPGIPEAQLGEIFRRFTRVDGEQREGAGLGLSICREVIQHHQGKIWAEPGAIGARFVVMVPLSGHIHVITGIHDIPEDIP